MRLTAPLALLLLILLAFAPARAIAQETEPADGTRVSAVQLSGVERRWLSPGLQDSIDKLTGAPLSRAQVRELADRLEAEQPRYVVAIRITGEPDGTARVTIVAARIREQARDTDINSKYLVDRVDVRGVAEREISAGLRSALDALTGKPFDADVAEQLGERIRAEFSVYTVIRRMERSRERGRVRIVYLLQRPDWAQYLRFEPIDANAVFHSDQGWGGTVPLAIRGGDLLISPVVSWDDGDALIEEFSGFALRLDSRRLGSERLGMFLEWSTANADWRDDTLAAFALNPQIPAPYRNRMSVTPLVKFAFTPQLSIAGGVGITELDPLTDDPALPSQMANVVIGSVRYKQQWGASSRPARAVGVSFTARTATSALESDFTYERYLLEADYRFRYGRHSVVLSGLAGGISGTAPMFERFSLGDTRTLRGWNKHDLAPLGGDRMFHTSAEYRRHDLLLFVDAGSVWDAGASKHVRFSTGVGITPGPFFATIGFPINTDEFRAVFAMGFRFGISSTSVRKD